MCLSVCLLPELICFPIKQKAKDLVCGWKSTVGTYKLIGGVIKRQQDLEGTDLRSGLIHRRLCDDCVRPYGEVVELGSRSGIHAL